MEFYMFLIIGIFLVAVFLLGFIICIVEKDFEIFPYALIALIFGIVLIGSSSFLKERTGTVCSVEKVQTSYTQTVIDGEIERVPVYSYLILFQTEDGEYRTFTTIDINYGILKEGDSIAYTLDDTEKIKEGE